jgi:hypothetical protein
MSELTFQVPESTQIRVTTTGPTGEEQLLFVDDLISLDQELSASQENITNDQLVAKREIWTGRFAAALSAKHGVEISPGKAYFLAAHVSREMRRILGN